MQKYIIIFLLIALAYTQTSKLALFQNWKRQYKKVYRTSAEELYRYEIFNQNLQIIKKLQSQDETATYGPTEFADLTPSEFAEMYLLYGSETADKCKLLHQNDNDYKQRLYIVNTPPESFDWEAKGAVNEPRNQGSCGSCWTFSTVATLEGQTKIKHDKLLELSEQQLVDCDKYNHGCSGGFMSDAFKWLMENGGIMSRSDYPYKGKQQQCQFVKEKAVVQVQGYTDIPKEQEDQMVDLLYTHGPIAIGLNANPLQFYSGGILNPKICSIDGINHGVSGVGYGVEKGTLFWRIKNSWGKTWGEKGFFRIIRGVNKCGLAECASIVDIQ